MQGPRLRFDGVSEAKKRARGLSRLNGRLGIWNKGNGSERRRAFIAQSFGAQPSIRAAGLCLHGTDGVAAARADICLAGFSPFSASISHCDARKIGVPGMICLNAVGTTGRNCRVRYVRGRQHKHGEVI